MKPTSWNDKKAKYDIRDWDEEHKKMGEGVTLSVEKLKELRDILNVLMYCVEILKISTLMQTNVDVFILQIF